MSAFQFLCNKCVDKNIKCCEYETCKIKYDEDSELNQPCFFKKCKSLKVEFYSYKAIYQEIIGNLVSLIPKTIGIGPYQMGIARLLNISPTTLLKRISEIIIKFHQSVFSTKNTCEIEVRSIFIGHKINNSTSSLYRLIWIKHPLKRKLEKLPDLIWAIVEPTKLCEKLLAPSRFHSPKLFFLTG